jgi:hypothetical protein
MNLSTRQLAFLEYEMSEIKEDSERVSEDRHTASAILRKVVSEIEWKENQNASRAD